MLLVIDNYDSFTHMLVNYLQCFDLDVLVKQNDELSIEQIEALAPELLLLSPGPCTPNEAGISLQAIRHFAGKIPMLGVCLGHEAIAQAFGARIVKAKQVMHGKTSIVHHKGVGLFNGLPNAFQVTRYHSLVVEQASLPPCIEVTAWTQDDHGNLDEIMAIRHKEYAIEGVQFHPESVLTEQGMALLAQFIQQAKNSKK